jgi:hypothetical protein
LCSLVSAIWGPQIYFTPLSVIHQHAIWSSLIYPFELGTKTILEHANIEKDLVLIDVLVFVMGIAVFVSHVPACIYHVYKTPHRKESMPSALFKAYPILLYIASGFLICSTDFFWNKNVFWILSLSSTLSFGVYTTQVILAYIVDKHYPSPSALWSLLSLSLFIKYSDYKYSELLLICKIYMTFFTVYYIYFIDSIFTTFCTFLKMSWYKVPLENQKQLLNEIEMKNK